MKKRKDKTEEFRTSTKADRSSRSVQAGSELVFGQSNSQPTAKVFLHQFNLFFANTMAAIQR